VSRRVRKSAAAKSSSPRDVAIANRHPRLRLNRRSVRHVIAVLDAHADMIVLNADAVPAGEISIAFLADAELAQLHGEFLDDPTTTDVITFEGNPSLELAGEICVSADTAARYAKEHGHDFSTELTLYIVHGWLHLAGHDDLVPKKKRAMRRAEARAMTVLRREHAIPKFMLAP
jgi:probable rRNA maturation factor